MNEKLLERFLRYVKIFSTSSSEQADIGVMPSTPCQRIFAETLATELREIGLVDVQITEHGYVYGFLPAAHNYEKAESFCLLAHIDTVEEVSGLNVQPIVHKNYTGSPISLCAGFMLDPKDDVHLQEAEKLQETIITSDGTTLLGADDKAGIAIIMSAIDSLAQSADSAHGKIEIVFSPDEETGHGMDFFEKDLAHIVSSKRAYTVDGGHIGTLETECFNAVGTDVFFIGKSVHTGTARSGGFVNAVSMASAFVQSLPLRERPETTDGYEGFFAPMEICGTIEKSKVSLLLRDFDAQGLERRKKTVEQLAHAAALSFGGSAEVTHKTQYKNMREKLEETPSVTEDLIAAYKGANIEPVNVPIRGGTDGSRLTEMGIPTPNIFTGAHNMHSRYEWASLEQMQKAQEVIVRLAEIIARKRR